jgi:Tol biopolymer transport system component
MLDVSPDGSRLAVVVRDHADVTIWLQDIVRGGQIQLTSEGEAFWPRWRPDGRSIPYQFRLRGRTQLAWQSADGTPALPPLAGEASVPSSWSPDGRQLALVKDDHIWMANFQDSKSSLRQVTSAPHSERWPAFSPDGRWLAYASNVSGRFEVYVRPWPESGPTEQVSLAGGLSPAWNPRGRELFFLSLPDPSTERAKMMVAEVGTASALRLGAPRPLFEFSARELFGCSPARCFGVAPDGQRFYVTQRPPDPPTPSVTQIHLVQNWTEEMKSRLAETAGP